MTEHTQEHRTAFFKYRDEINAWLESLIYKNPNSLKSFVAQDLLDADCPVSYLHDVLTHGCVSGFVTALIYYNQTHSFYDKYYDTIEELRLQFEDEFGHTMRIEGDLKNTYAWFAYEQTAHDIMYSMQDELPHVPGLIL